ncbi:MAG: hypothetical protein JSV38_16160 [Desulfobacterales bacterium]|nr:MAG: hypothetical protein JSV38_16160 [Desulfobacterales bacterium]
MDNIENILDEEAKKLFQKLQGIDTSYGKDRLTESLEEEKKREDEKKILLVELIHLLSAVLMDVNLSIESKTGKETFAHFAETYDKLTETSPKKQAVLVRYRGFPNDPNVTEKNDYEIIYGNTIVDFAAVSDIIKHIGYRMAHLSDQLSRAFNVFSTHNIFSLYMKIPGSSDKQRDRFNDTLQALSRYKAAVETNSPIVFLKKGGESKSFPLVCNETGLPDENLTLLAVANNLKPHTIKILADRVGKSSLKDRYMSIYNAIFAVKKLKGRLVKPPIEVNNVIWLLADQEKEIVTQEKAEVARIAIEHAGGSPQKAAKVLKSVYGNDYEKIDSKNLGERLQLSSNLLNTVKEKPKTEKIEKEILGNIETRLEQVQEKVFDDLFVQQGTDLAASKKKLGIFGVLHDKLLDIVTFYKRRIDTKKKMREMVHRAINFNLQDYETLAEDFDITIEDAKGLIEMLRECFDEHGRFMRGSFVRIMPDFSRYERKIFEFLWHYLREYIHQKDRTAYLNSLQLLIARMQKPKKAIKILLSDFCQDANNINYSDSKALMLCSLLIRKYNKELIDLEITPEDVLQVTEGLDLGVAKYTEWKIDKDQNNFFEKIRTIHQNLIKALDPSRRETPSIALPFLISLEREAYLLFSLVGGNTARSIVLSAVKDYGDPESMIYHGRESKKNIGALLQNLRIAIRGLGRIGRLDDLSVFDEVKGNEKRLAALGKSSSCKRLVSQIMDRIEESTQQIIQKD